MTSPTESPSLQRMSAQTCGQTQNELWVFNPYVCNRIRRHQLSRHFNLDAVRSNSIIWRALNIRKNVLKIRKLNRHNSDNHHLHGQFGVFASKRIKKDSAVGFYRGSDVPLARIYDGSIDLSDEKADRSFGYCVAENCVCKHESASKKQKNSKKWRTSHRSRHCRVVFPTRLSPCDDTNLMSYINDHRYADKLRHELINVEAWEIPLCNHRCLIVFITTQDVRAGQELFIDYGEKYWGVRSTTN